jgi:hypothetical protein
MRCPVCRADGNSTEQCRRCKADLSLLVKLESERSACLAAAQWHAGRDEAEQCLANARKAHALHKGKDSLRLLAVGSLMNRDFATAWKAHLEWMHLL